jgi:hypothetical protein
MREPHYGRLAVMIVLLVSGTCPAPDAIAQDYSCKIRSEVTQLFTIVYEVHPDGNPGKLLWQGTLKNGQQNELKSEYGRIFYRYKTDPDAQSEVINGVNRFCRNGEIINLP